jgi:hypothetical protein
MLSFATRSLHSHRKADKASKTVRPPYAKSVSAKRRFSTQRQSLFKLYMLAVRVLVWVGIGEVLGNPLAQALERADLQRLFIEALGSRLRLHRAIFKAAFCVQAERGSLCRLALVRF